MLCQLIAELAPQLPVRPCNKLIAFVKDLALCDNATKIKTQLDWTPTVTVETGLRRTVE